MRLILKSLVLILSVLLIVSTMGCIGIESGTKIDDSGADDSNDNIDSGFKSFVSSITGGTGNAKIDDILKSLPAQPEGASVFMFTDAEGNLAKMNPHFDVFGYTFQKRELNTCVMDADNVRYIGGGADELVIVGNFDKEGLEYNSEANYKPRNYHGVKYLYSQKDRYYTVILSDEKILYSMSEESIKKMIDVQKGKEKSMYDSCDSQIKSYLDKLTLSADYITCINNMEEGRSGGSSSKVEDNGEEVSCIVITTYPSDEGLDELYEDMKENIEYDYDPQYIRFESMDREGNTITVKYTRFKTG